jgi:hypothetical protein
LEGDYKWEKSGKELHGKRKRAGRYQGISVNPPRGPRIDARIRWSLKITQAELVKLRLGCNY